MDRSCRDHECLSSPEHGGRFSILFKEHRSSKNVSDFLACMRMATRRRAGLKPANGGHHLTTGHGNVHLLKNRSLEWRLLCAYGNRQSEKKQRKSGQSVFHSFLLSLKAQV